MFRKNLAVLFFALVFALANVSAYADGGYTHVYVAQKSFEGITDPQIKKAISDNMWAYYLGAHFPDVGYTSDNLTFLTDLLPPNLRGVVTSGKSYYGEATHWDGFLESYKSILLSRYQHPFTDSPTSAVAVAFILGVATHRVSDDIWHNYADDPKDKHHDDYAFKSCDKKNDPFCYYGFISKLADLEALDRNYAHIVADSGIDFVIIKTKPPIDVPFTKVSSLPLDIAAEALNATATVDGRTYVDGSTGLCLESNASGHVYTLRCNVRGVQNWKRRGQTLVNVDTDRCLDSNASGDVYTLPCNGGNFQNWERRGQTLVDVATNRCLDSNASGNVYALPCNGGDFQNWNNPIPVTVEDFIKDFGVYKLLAVDAMVELAQDGPSVIPGHPSFGDYKRRHNMDWALSNYETDPDVGLNKIIGHVTKFISEFGAGLKGQ